MAMEFGSSRQAGDVLLLGVKGSGKTVFLSVLGRRFEHEGVLGLCLVPQGGTETDAFVTDCALRLEQDRRFPEATSRHTRTLLRWEVQAGSRSLFSLSSIDCAGETILSAFCGDDLPEADSSASDELLSSAAHQSSEREIVDQLRSMASGAAAICLVVNPNDLLTNRPRYAEENEGERREFEKRLLDMRRLSLAIAQSPSLRSKPMFLLLTQTGDDAVRSAVERAGGPREYLEPQFPALFRSAPTLECLAVSAVNEVEERQDPLTGRHYPVPCPRFTSSGLPEFLVRVGGVVARELAPVRQALNAYRKACRESVMLRLGAASVPEDERLSAVRSEVDAVAGLSSAATKFISDTFGATPAGRVCLERTEREFLNPLQNESRRRLCAERAIDAWLRTRVIRTDANSGFDAAPADSSDAADDWEKNAADLTEKANAALVAGGYASFSQERLFGHSLEEAGRWLREQDRHYAENYSRDRVSVDESLLARDIGEADTRLQTLARNWPKAPCIQGFRERLDGLIGANRRRVRTIRIVVAAASLLACLALWLNLRSSASAQDAQIWKKAKDLANGGEYQAAAETSARIQDHPFFLLSRESAVDVRIEARWKAASGAMSAARKGMIEAEREMNDKRNALRSFFGSDLDAVSLQWPFDDGKVPDLDPIQDLERCKEWRDFKSAENKFLNAKPSSALIDETGLPLDAANRDQIIHDYRMAERAAREALSFLSAAEKSAGIVRSKRHEAVKEALGWKSDLKTARSQIPYPAVDLEPLAEWSDYLVDAKTAEAAFPLPGPRSPKGHEWGGGSAPPISEAYGSARMMIAGARGKLDKAVKAAQTAKANRENAESDVKNAAHQASSTKTALERREREVLAGFRHKQDIQNSVAWRTYEIDRDTALRALPSLELDTSGPLPVGINLDEKRAAFDHAIELLRKADNSLSTAESDGRRIRDSRVASEEELRVAETAAYQKHEELQKNETAVLRLAGETPSDLLESDEWKAYVVARDTAFRSLPAHVGPGEDGLGIPADVDAVRTRKKFQESSGLHATAADKLVSAEQAFKERRRRRVFDKDCEQFESLFRRADASFDWAKANHAFRELGDDLSVGDSDRLSQVVQSILKAGGVPETSLAPDEWPALSDRLSAIAEQARREEERKWCADRSNLVHSVAAAVADLHDVQPFLARVRKGESPSPDILSPRSRKAALDAWKDLLLEEFPKEAPDPKSLQKWKDAFSGRIAPFFQAVGEPACARPLADGTAVVDQPADPRAKELLDRMRKWSESWLKSAEEDRDRAVSSLRNAKERYDACVRCEALADAVCDNPFSSASQRQSALRCKESLPFAVKVTKGGPGNHADCILDQPKEAFSADDPETGCKSAYLVYDHAVGRKGLFEKGRSNPSGILDVDGHGVQPTKNLSR